MYDDEMFLPTPLTITIDRAGPDESRGGTSPGRQYFVVTAAQYPGISAVSEVIEGAVEILLEKIRDAQPMSPALVQALLDADHSRELVQEWGRIMWGRRRLYRFDADATLSVLAEYAARGVPAVAACGFFELDMSPDDAGQVHAAGGGPEEARKYIDASATHKWWQWDFDVMAWLTSGLPFERGRLYVDSRGVEDAVAWERIVTIRALSDSVIQDILRLGLAMEVVASGFPTERVRLYVANLVSPGAAVAWEEVVAAHNISEMDLTDVLRAAFTPEESAAYLRANAASGSSLGAAARLQLALAAPQTGPSRASSGAPF